MFAERIFLALDGGGVIRGACSCRVLRATPLDDLSVLELKTMNHVIDRQLPLVMLNVASKLIVAESGTVARFEARKIACLGDRSEEFWHILFFDI